jgi:hypothetical protein
MPLLVTPTTPGRSALHCCLNQFPFPTPDRASSSPPTNHIAQLEGHLSRYAQLEGWGWWTLYVIATFINYQGHCG